MFVRVQGLGPRLFLVFPPTSRCRSRDRDASAGRAARRGAHSRCPNNRVWRKTNKTGARGPASTGGEQEAAPKRRGKPRERRQGYRRRPVPRRRRSRKGCHLAVAFRTKAGQLVFHLALSLAASGHTAPRTAAMMSSGPRCQLDTMWRHTLSVPPIAWHVRHQRAERQLVTAATGWSGGDRAKCPAQTPKQVNHETPGPGMPRRSLASTRRELTVRLDRGS